MTTYLDKEIDKVFDNKELVYPLNVAMSCAWIMGNMKGINLKILDVDKSSLADYFILASASNHTQAQSMANTIVGQLRRKSLRARSVEGLIDSDWILIDLGDVIVHIFLENSRDFYKLDELWEDAKIVEIPSEYYLTHDDEDQFDSIEKGRSDNEYF